MRISLFFLFFAVGILPAFAQQPAPVYEQQAPVYEQQMVARPDAKPASIRFERITVDDGLSSQSGINAMLQDRRGFVWIRTFVGLNRYDGYSFTHYQSIPFDSTSIASNLIYYGLHEDRSGALWIGNTEGGLNRLDPVTGKFTRWKHILGDTTSLTSGSVTAVHESRSGDLWVGTDGVLVRGMGGSTG